MTQVADAWLTWIAGSLLRDVPAEQICADLVDAGLPENDAQREVDAIRSSPTFRAVDQALGRTRRAHLLRRANLRTASTRVPRMPVDPDVYRDVYLANQVPVVLEGATAHWPALAWTWPELRARYGHLEVEALADRDSDPDHDVTWEAHVRPMTFAELIDHATNPSTGDNVYATARSGLSRGGLLPLHDDIPGIDGLVKPGAGGVAFLIGAAGAHTALHYDISTTLLCQVLGRKRIVLVPPEEDIGEDPPLWAERGALDDPMVTRREVVLEPGEALSIPVGWWHEATALDPCFTVTLANLEHSPNRFPDFSPIRLTLD